MKKMKYGFTLVFIAVAMVALAQDSTVVEPARGKFWELYDKFGTIFWMALTALGVTVFFKTKLAKVITAGKEVVTAFEVVQEAAKDNEVNEAEFQRIVDAKNRVVAAVKDIFKKEPKA